MESGNKTYRWEKIAESMEELPWQSNGLCEVVVSGKRICVAKKGDEVKACAVKCPHAGGRMADGYLDPMGNIVCPLLRYRFSLEKGRNVSGEGYYLKTYPLEKRDDGVYIGVETGGLWDIFR